MNTAHLSQVTNTVKPLKISSRNINIIAFPISIFPREQKIPKADQRKNAPNYWQCTTIVEEKGKDNGVAQRDRESETLNQFRSRANLQTSPV